MSFFEEEIVSLVMINLVLDLERKLYRLFIANFVHMIAEGLDGSLATAGLF